MIKLPEEALVQLFKNEKIYVVPELDASAFLPVTQKKYQLLILCNGEKELPAEEQTQLNKIINALKLKEQDILKINLPASPPFHGIAQKIDFENLLVFGFTQCELALNVTSPVFHLFTFSGKKIIFSESLGTLIENADARKMLWKQLQLMFGLS